MVGPGMFDGLIRVMLIIGILIGVALCGLAYGALVLWSHLQVSWR